MEDLFEGNKDVLKSMLLDEERLITYVSLSKELCIHVNSSKLLLTRLIEEIRQEQPSLQLNVNYVVSGAIDNTNARTVICSEEELSEQKHSYKNVFFEHIYSVCKGRPNLDTAAFLSVNKFDDFALCSGYIKSNLCKKRTSVEINNLKSSSQETIVPNKTKSLPLKKEKQESTTNIKDNSAVKTIVKENKTNSEPVIKHEHVSPIKEKIDITKNKDITSNGQKSQKGIAGFFSKSNNESNKKEIKKLNDVEVKVEKQSDIKVEKKAVEVLPSHTSIKTVEKRDKSNKNLDQIKKSSKVDKKRKRVLHVSDSESDNENNDPFTDNTITEQEMSYAHESDDEIPPTPTTNNIKITSGIVNPKKKRKVVDKTYTDEDGYVLTKKEEIYESCSDNEENKVPEKPQPVKEVKTEVTPKSKGSKKKISPPQKGKQSMLTNFFKKI